MPTEGFNDAVDPLASRLRSWGELRIAEGLKVRSVIAPRSAATPAPPPPPNLSSMEAVPRR